MTSLSSIAQALVVPGKGILAADETPAHLGKEFETNDITSTPETHQAWRELLFSTPGIHDYISGVILSDETIHQTTTSGQPFAAYLNSLGIIPGIKVDGGLASFQNSSVEKITNGLEGLADRLGAYYAQGARFAKWRAAFTITDETPSAENIAANAEELAEYAYFCQESGIVPIVEPEVLMDGNHSIERCYEVTTAVLKEVFVKLDEAGIDLTGILLKPNMILPGETSGQAIEPFQVADFTVRCLKKCVPASVPGIVFLSGGQSEDVACQTLNAIIGHSAGCPWPITYSYGRALQTSAQAAWAGKSDNVQLAQQAFLDQARRVSLAQQGKLLTVEQP